MGTRSELNQIQPARYLLRTFLIPALPTTFLLPLPGQSGLEQYLKSWRGP